MTQPEHPSAERISDLLAGVLPAAEAMDVNAHLASCGACRDERAALLDLTALLADVGATPLEMPSDVAASIDVAIGRASAERVAGVASIDQGRRPTGRQPWRKLVGAAAAVVVVGVGFAGLKTLPAQQDSVASDDSAASPHHPPTGRGISPTAGNESDFSTDPVSGYPSSTPGEESVGGGSASSIARAEVRVRAKKLAYAPQIAVSPASRGCATPEGGGPSTVVRFRGDLAVLVITRDTRLATIYDCATATKTLFLTGY